MDPSLSEYYRAGDDATDKVDKFLQETVGKHYVIAAAVILVLVLLVLWHWFKYDCDAKPKAAESFNPTATMRAQQRDGLGESMTATPSSAEVLASADYGCSERKTVGDDAWSWMAGAAAENMTVRPKTDNDFSRVLAGN